MNISQEEFGNLNSYGDNNLSNMEKNLNGADKLKHKDDIKSNRDHLNSLKIKSSSEWREYATQCMIEIMNHKGQ